MTKHAALFAAALMLATPALAETWNMPTPYGDATFHTININQFAKDVAKATDGALQIKVHSAGSLFPHAEVKDYRLAPVASFGGM